MTDEQAPRPWVSVSDALDDLPHPESDHDIPNHVAVNHSEETVEKLRETEHGQARHPAYARAYPDEPAYTLVGGHMSQPVHHDDPRRLTVRECCRLQSLPDWFEVQGTKSKQYVQIGNCVPSLLAQRLAENLAIKTDGTTRTRNRGNEDG